MGHVERRRRETEEIKKKIIDAATQLFLEEGYEKVSMRKIAQQIDYSPTTIYLYFANKDEILSHLLQKGFSQFMTAITDAIAEHEGADVIGKIRAGLRAYMQFGLDSPDYYKLIFVENLQRINIALKEDDSGLKIFDQLVVAIRGGVEQGVFVQEDPYIISQSLWASIHGVTSLITSFEKLDGTNKERLMNHHIDLLLRGLTKPSS
ncbi:TetR/AcrR family transcriptional regulator [Brevibacillus dissolubilis]|uniref:TetR/AcrR family transcriptional regulator n=1 Tax=Brevibacillus dissolubilis TaxID=1844116 RepID=UPI00111643F7|nr:TetR/AcrR family transcriptional regulator [Brevibacillus dissolubilis]